MLYEKLNREVQRMVDECAAHLAPLSWGRKADLLAEAAAAFGQDLGPERGPLAAKGFVTAVLERWDDDEIEDPRQALLYLASLSEEHRARAERYLEENPEIGASVARELEEDEE